MRPCAKVVAAVLVLVCVEHAIRAGVCCWFTKDLPPPEVVRRWSESEMDGRLFKLSRWDQFNQSQFEQCVARQIRPLNISSNERFVFLEVGAGIGAFSRRVLQMHPRAMGHASDSEQQAIDMASVVLHRMTVSVENMLRLSHPDSSFDYVFAPACLCYLHTNAAVRTAVSEFKRVLKPGGGMCASMLPAESSRMGSCSMRVPAEVFMHIPGLKVVGLENMDDWGIPHSMGRYSVCLRKV